MLSFSENIIFVLSYHVLVFSAGILVKFWFEDSILFKKLMAFLVVYPMRKLIQSKKTGPTINHSIMLVVGFSYFVWCYNERILHPIIHTIICIAIIKTVEPGKIGLLVSVISFLYIFYVQYQSIIVVGMMMFNTQKFTSLAFSISDGMKLNEGKKLVNEKHEKLAIRESPSILKILSYIYRITSIKSATHIFYKDYINYMEGQSPIDDNILNKLIFKKLSISGVCYIIFGFLEPYNFQDNILGKSITEYSIIWQMIYIYIFNVLYRIEDYYKWRLSEATSHNMGIGFNGYDKNSDEKWDLVDNVSILSVEFPTNIKDVIDNWNNKTRDWLRFVIYDRATVYKRTSVFILSALWHGLNPGKLFFFGNCCLMYNAANLARKYIRPYFLKNEKLHRFYNILTFIVTRIGVEYVSFGYHLDEFYYVYPNFLLYRSMYFFYHVACIAVIVVCIALKCRKEKIELKEN